MNNTPVRTDDILSKLRGVARTENGYRAICPACNGPGDLDIQDADGAPQLECAAGCSQKVIHSCLNGRPGGVEVEVGSGDKIGKRLVKAIRGEKEHRDRFDVADAFKRKKFLDELKKRFGITNAQLESLDARLIAEADSIDERNCQSVEALDNTISPVMVNLADVEPETVKWLWPNRIAFGKLTLIVGDPGTGKSFLTRDLAARVSRGSPWPDDQSAHAQCGSVVILSAEDGLADTIRPRLDAAGAAVTRITALEATQYTAHDETTGKEKVERRPFNLVFDLPALERAIKSVRNCQLVIIDPITAYLGDSDSHKNAEIRGVLAPLAELADHHQVAMVAVTHLNKSSTMAAIYRTMGSVAFVADARAVWAVVRDKKDPQRRRRLFLPIKNNLGNDRTGLAFELTQPPAGSDVACISWFPDPVDMDTDVAMSMEPDRRRKQLKLDVAKNWLLDVLSDGPVPAAEIEERAEKDGIKHRTLERAKEKLGVIAERHGYSKDGEWLWRLPEEPKSANTPTHKTMAHNEGFGALWKNLEENGVVERPIERQISIERQESVGPEDSKERQISIERQCPEYREDGAEWGEVC